MKTLKEFVRQQALPKGCMLKGYIVNEYFFFISKFLKQMHVDAPLMWDGDHDEE
jgi:hypothetical protein